ncbi:MAG: isocitrate/isopropylmalate dehydrogenase family protein [Candidatus Geothermarchaeales archaeon]
MRKYKICRIPGDDIGPEVMEACMLVLDELDLNIDWIDAEAGWACWEKYGTTVPDHTWERLREAECCLFSAITSKPGIPGFKSAIVWIRQAFDLYANVRPIKAYPGCPLNYRDDIDFVVVRENTEGLYKGIEFHPTPKELLELSGLKDYNPDDMAISLRVFTREGCERIVRFAFDLAKKQGRKSVVAAHKANIIRKTCGMFLESAQRVAKDYPDIEFWDINIDALAMRLVKHPQIFDVIVTTNMFGDIIADEAGQLVGGLGLAPSANIGEEYALFEPIHGSAPKYKGMYKVNPMAQILSAKLMLEWLGEEEMAGRVEAAVAAVIKEGRTVTYDLGGEAGTLAVARAVAERLRE